MNMIKNRKNVMMVVMVNLTMSTNNNDDGDEDVALDDNDDQAISTERTLGYLWDRSGPRQCGGSGTTLKSHPCMQAGWGANPQWPLASLDPRAQAPGLTAKSLSDMQSQRTPNHKEYLGTIGPRNHPQLPFM